MTDADEALVQREITRLKEQGADADIAMASLLADVPVPLAVEFIRDSVLRALGGAQQGEYWLRVQELNWLAHRRRRAEARARRAPYVGTVYNLMAVIPDE